MSRGNVRICILGGGVNGLTCAVHLLETRRNVDVTIVHDLPLHETTSFGPPGVFRPSASGPRRTMKQWTKYSFEKFNAFAQSSDASTNGVQYVSGFQLSDDLSWLKDQDNYFGDIVYNFRWLADADLKIFSQNYKYGVFYTTFTAEGQLYTPWLLEKAKSLGAKFVQKKISNFNELIDNCDVIVNCAGLRSAHLVKDTHIRSQRGILVQVDAPWIKNFVYAGNDETFICPGRSTVFLGTVRQMDDWRLTVEKNESKEIIERCSKILPSLKEARVVKEWAGLRPYRMNPRLEKEIIESSGRKFPIIHNYGHGGNGFVMSWGCANQVVSHIDEIFHEKSKL